jgi:oxygen-independent coproporphyrinogen-3 oxidase
MIEHKLLDKYNQALPRYTSYPPASFFHAGFTGADYLKAIEASNRETPAAISLYIHIPFCPQLCLYCGCTTHISQNQSLIQRYIDALIKEIEMIAARLDTSRSVTQIHWGGGTPNALEIGQVEKIMSTINRLFSVGPHTETAMECNPAYLTREYLDRLLKLGFNRISLGIQDFDTKVLEAVHRAPSVLPVEELATQLREGGASANLDFIYGLPLQTPASFVSAIRKAVEIRPDRLVTFSYAHVPWVKSHQSVLEKYDLPGADEKMAMFEGAWNELTQAGYVPIGMDHFALPGDPLSIALQDHQLHRNFQGYCTRETTGQVYAFGMSAISQLHSAYAQNTKNIPAYIQSVNEGHPPIERGYRTDATDIAVREVINEIMCNNFLSWEKVAKRLGLETDQLKTLTGFEESSLVPLAEDGLLTYSYNTIEVSQTGRFLIRNLAALFDPKLKGADKRFSKTI